MADIVEIIHKLSFELQGRGLDEAIRKLQEQSKGIDALKEKEKELTTQIQQGGRLNVNEMQKLHNERIKVRKLIERETQVLQANFSQNIKLQEALKSEIGLIEKLEQQLKELAIARKSATNPVAITAYNNQIADIRRQLAELTGSQKSATGAIGKGNLVNNIGQGLLYGLGVGGGFGVVTRLTSEIVQLASESAKAYREIEGIRIAFDRLGQPELLASLREATKGTVDDLTLMQYAVQAKNFEVPLSKLAGLFRFAQQRARETGVEVDYLVKSIITGIGRESPKILDNLGLNVRTIREEFNRTGDYATAVFNVIEKQGVGATGVISTMADEHESLNANIKNTQAEYGQFFAELEDRAKAVGLDILTVSEAFLGDQESGRKLYDNLFRGARTAQIDFVNQSINLTKQQREQEAIINKQADNLYENQFKQFAKDIEGADYQHKQILIQQQKDLYAQLLRISQAGLLNIFSLQRANQRFIEESGAGRDVRLSIGSKKQLPLQELMFGSYTLEQLREFQKEINQAQGQLGKQDEQGIRELLRYEKEIQRQVDIITGVEKKVKEKKDKISKNKIRLQDILELSPEAQSAILEELDDFITKIQKRTDEFKERFNKDASSLGREGFISGPSGLNSVDSATNLPDLIQIARNQRDAEKDQEKKDKETRDIRIANINAIADAYVTAAQAIAQALDTIYQAQARSLDNEIRIREQRVEAATELAERGNAELLNLERQRLEAAQDERERVARRQIAVNAALQVSNSLVAVARAASETGPYAAVAAIAAIIAALATGYGAVQSLTQDTEPGFREGVVGFKGKGTGTSDSNRVRISNGESVIPADVTQNNRAALEAMIAGKQYIPAFNIPSKTGSSSTMSVKGLEKRLDTLIQAQENSAINVTQKADARGFSQAVERHTYRNKNRNRR